MFAAACEDEKEAWLSTIRESLSPSVGHLDEAVTSLHAVSSSTSHPEKVSFLPTIMSTDDINAEDPHAGSVDGHASIKNESTGWMHQDNSLQGSHSRTRHASGTSVRSILAAGFGDKVARLPPSSKARRQADQDLLDVFSAVFLTARFTHRQEHGELFQSGNKTVRPAFSRSNSRISMAGAMGAAAMHRLTRRETTSPTKQVPAPSAFPANFDEVKPRRSRIGSGNMTAFEKPPPIMIYDNNDRKDSVQHPKDGVGDATPHSQSPSPTPSPLLATPSTVMSQFPDGEQGAKHARAASVMIHKENGQDIYYRPKRTRSMVNNVRDFFQNRPSPPAHHPILQPPIPNSSEEPVENSSDDTPKRKWLSSGSIRRRPPARSATADNMPTAGLLSSVRRTVSPARMEAAARTQESPSSPKLTRIPTRKATSTFALLQRLSPLSAEAHS